MLQRFQRRLANDKRSAFTIKDTCIAFAQVDRGKDGVLHLATAAVDKEVDNEDWEQLLANPANGIDLGKSKVSTVLPYGSYQLLLVELPNVPANEMRSAIRWQVKDLLDYPVDQAVIEFFEMPEQATGSKKSMAYAVATRRSDLQEHIEIVRGAGLSLDVIDIPELCTRNITSLLSQDDDGVAFLHFTEKHGLLTVTRQGVLYLIRRIDIGRSDINAVADDDFARTELISNIVLETQRSLDYYESHFDRRPVTELLLAPGSDIGGLAESLNDQLGLNISSLNLNGLFEMETPLSTDEQAECLLAIGAALRTESKAA